MNKDSKADLLLALCCALLGEIPTNLHACAIKAYNSTIQTFFYFNGEISEEDEEAANCINTYTICGFPNITTEIITRKMDHSILLPSNGMIYAYSKTPVSSDRVSQHEMNHLPLESRAVLSIAQALLGNDLPNLRASGIKKTFEGFEAYFLLAHPASISESSLLKKISRQICLDFPKLHVTIHEKLIPPTQQLPALDKYAFIKKE